MRSVEQWLSLHIAMGAEESKAHVEHNDDQHVEIINLQNEHSNKIDQNTLLLWIVLIVSGVQLALSVNALIRRNFNKKALKKAHTLADLSKISVEK